MCSSKSSRRYPIFACYRGVNGIAESRFARASCGKVILIFLVWVCCVCGTFNLPASTATEALKILRSRPGPRAHIPVYSISANAMPL